METNISTYRAEIDEELCTIAEFLCENIGGKWYAIGNYDPKIRNDKITPSINVFDKKTNMFLDFFIKKDTLAIHFPDMLANDSDRLLPNGEKDLRIFASLSEDGKGGDMLEYPDSFSSVGIVKYKDCLFFAEGKKCHINHFSFGKCKAIGIQQ